MQRGRRRGVPCLHGWSCWVNTARDTRGTRLRPRASTTGSKRPGAIASVGRLDGAERGRAGGQVGEQYGCGASTLQPWAMPMGLGFPWHPCGGGSRGAVKAVWCWGQVAPSGSAGGGPRQH